LKNKVTDPRRQSAGYFFPSQTAASTVLAAVCD